MANTDTTRSPITALDGFWNYWINNAGTVEGIASFETVKKLVGFFVSVGSSGQNYPDIRGALDAGYRHIHVQTDITENADWGIITDDIILYADQERTINFSVANTGDYNIRATNIKFSISGTNHIFGDGSRFKLFKCSIFGDTAENQFSGGDTVIDADILTINTGATGNINIKYLRFVDKLILTGAGDASPEIKTLGGIIDEIANDTVSNRTVALSNSIVNGVSGTQLKLQMGADSVLKRTINTTIYIQTLANGWSVYHSDIATLFITSDSGKCEGCVITAITYGALGADIIYFKNNTIEEAASFVVSNVRIIDCTFDDNLSITGDNIVLQNPKIAGDLSIGAAADSTEIIGGYLDGTYSNAGTNTKVSGCVGIADTIIITDVNAATYNIVQGDELLSCSYTGTAAITNLQLMTAEAKANRIIKISDSGGGAGANNITITTEGAELIDGAATLVLSANYDSVTLYCDGTNWFTLK